MVEMWSTIPYNASLVDSVDMIVRPGHQKHVKEYLTCAGMEPQVIEEDLQTAIDQENLVENVPDDELVITRDTSKDLCFFKYSSKLL